MEQQEKKMLFSYDKQIIKNVINMAWPAIIEALFVAFVGLVDSYMVSTLGPNAVAAVGLTTQPKFLGLSIFFALNVSVSALVARRRGEKRQDLANRILITAFCFVIIAAAILSTTFVTLADDIIRLCGSSPETHDFAVTYYQVIMGGMIFNCIQMCVNSAQRGAGNTKITMRTNVTSNVVNVIMNYILINGKFGFPALGVQGAAIATVLGTVVASIMSILSVMNPDGFISIPYIFKNKVRPAISTFVNIIKVGYSVFFEQLLMRVGFMATALMAANQGNNAMAAHQVAMNIMGLSFAFGDGLQSTAVALIGRSLGEEKPDLAKEYGRTCRAIGALIAVVLTFIYYFGARPLCSLFFEDPAIVEIGVSILHVIIFVVIFQISQVIYMGCLRGAGDTAYTAMASTISVTLIRTFVSYFCGYVLNWGIVGIWMGVLGDQVSRYIFASTRFKAGKWVQIKI